MNGKNSAYPRYQTSSGFSSELDLYTSKAKNSSPTSKLISYGLDFPPSSTTGLPCTPLHENRFLKAGDLDDPGSVAGEVGDVKGL